MNILGEKWIKVLWTKGVEEIHALGGSWVGIWVLSNSLSLGCMYHHAILYLLWLTCSIQELCAHNLSHIMN